MNRLRTYGQPPFELAVIHGGPGAAGEMSSVAVRLAPLRGVLEPLQSAATLDKQVEELSEILQDHGAQSNILIGFSWGAWLSFVLTARYPALVRKLILISSGPFEDSYVKRIQECRFKRLSPDERIEFESLLAVLMKGKEGAEMKDNDRGSDEQVGAGSDPLLKRLGELSDRADTYESISGWQDDLQAIELNSEVFQTAMQDAIEMRRTGRLLAQGNAIRCPVVAIHGSYDPHPAAGVNEPLSRVLKDFRFHLLNHCGHKPWIERQARDEFYELLTREVRD
jgi:pimeloyl-ACP methyl ester carboxylesterase